MARRPAPNVGRGCRRKLPRRRADAGPSWRLLGLSCWDTEAFLKAHRAYLAYDEDDLEQDRRDLEQLDEA